MSCSSRSRLALYPSAHRTQSSIRAANAAAAVGCSGRVGAGFISYVMPRTLTSPTAYRRGLDLMSCPNCPPVIVVDEQGRHRRGPGAETFLAHA
jgi:hypothetical protein